MAAPDTAAEAVRGLLDTCFPEELLQPANEVRLTACHEHVKSRAFQMAPALTRRCSAILRGHSLSAAEDALAAVDAALEVLYGECDLRASAPAAASVPSAGARLLQRSLFMCAVMILHAALSSAPRATVHAHAEAALRCLWQISAGAVAAPELESLERRLLLELATSGRLPEILFNLLDASVEPRALPLPPPLQRTSPHPTVPPTATDHGPHGAGQPRQNTGGRPRVNTAGEEHWARTLVRSSPLALRWTATALALPAAAAALDPVLARIFILSAQMAPSAVATASLLKTSLVTPLYICIMHMHISLYIYVDVYM